MIYEHRGKYSPPSILLEYISVDLPGGIFFATESPPSDYIVLLPLKLLPQVGYCTGLPFSELSLALAATAKMHRVMYPRSSIRSRTTFLGLF